MNKKLLLWIFVFVLLSFNVFGGTMASYTSSYVDKSTAAINKNLSMGFVPTYSNYSNKISIHIGTATTGRLIYSIQTETSGHPSGSLVSSNSQEYISCDSLDDNHFINLTFNKSTYLNQSVRYWIVLQTQGGCTVQWRYRNTGGYTAGDGLENSGGGWVNVSSPPADFNFLVYDGYDDSLFSNFNLTDGQFNTSINNFSAYLNGILYYSDGLGKLVTPYFKSVGELVNVTFIAQNYTNRTYTNFNTSTDLSGVLNLSFVYLNISARNISGTKINNFTVYIKNINNPLDNKTITTTSGGILTNTSKNNNYNITIMPINYAYSSQTINTTHLFNYLNYSSYTKNSIMFNFFDEITKKEITNNISIELISTIESKNYTITSGTYIDLFTPTYYTIRYSSTEPPIYNVRTSYFTLSNNSFNNITLYLISSGNYSDIQINVIDGTTNPVEGVIVQALRYDISKNSYVLVESGETNFEGVTQLRLQKNTEYYKFFLFYPYGTLRKVTNPTYIYEDILNFQILITDQVIENFYRSYNVNANITFNNLTKNFRLNYADNGGVAQQYCLIISRTDGLKELPIQTSCLSTTSGTILIPITPINGSTYIGEAYAYYSDQPYLISAYNVFFPIKNPSGNMGLLAILLLTIATIPIARVSPQVGCILTPIPIFLGSIIGFIQIPVYLAAIPLVIGIILIFVLEKR